MNTEETYNDSADRTLTDEEIAILKEEEEEAKAAAEETEEPEVEAKAEEQEEPEVEDKAEEEPEAEEEPTEAEEEPPLAAKEEEADDKKPQVQDVFAPNYKVEAPSLEEIEEKIAALDKQMDDYEIEASEYRKQLRQLEDARNDAKFAAKVEELNRQNAQQKWEHMQQLFFAQHPEMDNKMMHSLMRTTIEEMVADEANAGHDYAWFLNEARKRVVDWVGTLNGGQKEEPAPEPKKAAPASKKPDLPKTLSSVPNAAAEPTGDRFSALDGLDGMDLEAALANMTEAEAAKFLAQMN